MIVVKRSASEDGDNFIPVPDGKETKFNAPLIVVDFAVGQDLRQALQQNQKVVLSVDFDAVAPAQQLPQSASPKLGYWLYPGGRAGYAGLLRLEPFIKSLLQNRSLGFEVNLLFPSAFSALPENAQVRDCYGNKTYCSIGLTDVARSLRNDSHLLDEGVRQKCMWLLSRDYFWEYVREYFELCLGPLVLFQDLDIRECAKQAQEKVDSEIEARFVLPEEKIRKCYEEAFEDPENKQASEVRVFRDQAISSTPLYNFEVVPALLIDRYIVRGGLGATSLASAICDSLTDAPKHICNNLADFKDRDVSLPRKAGQAPSHAGEPDRVSSSSLLLALAVLVAGLGLTLVCVLLLRRYVDRSFGRSVRDEVTDSVQRYMRVQGQAREASTEL